VRSRGANSNGPLPHGTSMIDRLPRHQVIVWAEKVRRLVAAGDTRGPDRILEGLGMEDPDHRGQVLKAYASGRKD
jgi:hypothetical protein